MEWKDLFLESYSSALKTVERALDGLTQENLVWQPRPDSNSIGWTTWHLTRELDAIISSITKEEQLWIRDKWHAKFNRSPDPADTGTGHSPEQVAAFECPDTNTLLDYYQAVQEESKHSITNLSSSDLSQKVDDPWSQLFPTVGSRLKLALEEALQHAGHVCYIRGLLQGKGWQEI
ncbi:MAG: DinB family protein [bacterium]